MSVRDPIKVYDARWEVPEFDDAAVTRLFEATYAYGRQLGVDTVTLARDGRLGAPRVLELAMAAAVRMGLRTVVCPDAISTTQGYFLALHTSCEHPNTMGLMVTASHNPRQYIGVKFTVPTVQAIGEDCGPKGGLTEIRRLYRSGESFAAKTGGSVRLVNLTREYIEFSMQQAGVRSGDLTGMGIVLDGFHGSAGPEVMTALQLAGARVEALRLMPDGEFPTGSPNPTSLGKMDRAIAVTAERDCAVTIGLDGDGDRIVFGDRRGLLNAGFAAVPILRTCVEEAGCGEEGRGDAARGRRGDKNVGSKAAIAALYDPKVNPLALAEWGKLRVRPVLFRNGHSQIKDYMRQVGAVAAAEESGHYYHRIAMRDLVVCCENSILTVMMFLGALKRQPGLMDELWSMQNRVRTTGEFNYQFADDATCDRAMAAVIQHFVGQRAGTTTATPDGIDLQGTVLNSGVSIDEAGVQLVAGWYSGYLRMATNEKAVVRAYFSAADPAVIERVEGEARQILAKQFSGAVVD